MCGNSVGYFTRGDTSLSLNTVSGGVGPYCGCHALPPDRPTIRRYGDTPTGLTGACPQRLQEKSFSRRQSHNNRPATKSARRHLGPNISLAKAYRHQWTGNEKPLLSGGRATSRRRPTSRGGSRLGVPMSHVKYKKQQCPLSLNCMVVSHVASKILSCRMLNLRNAPCRVLYFASQVKLSSMPHVDFKKCRC